MTRIKARSDNPAEPVFRLEGGPGKTNLAFANASRFADNRDVVLVGYRGVDGSVRLDCPEVVSAMKHSTDLLGQDAFRAYGKAYRSCATRLTDEGVDLAGYGVVQRVDDVETARKALGYDRINLVSESARTRYAMVYAWRYPESVHRSVMIGVNPPGHFVWDAKTTDEQFHRYATLCDKDETCSARTDDLVATIGRVNGDIPDRWGFLPIKEGNVRTAAFFGLMGTSFVRGDGGALGSGDSELLDLGGQGRRKRALVRVARWATSPFPSRSTGASLRRLALPTTWSPTATTHPVMVANNLRERRRRRDLERWPAGRRLAGDHTPGVRPRPDVGRGDAPDRRRA